jgi:ribosomal protein S18 acetylase RimI-like enzyme
LRRAWRPGQTRAAMVEGTIEIRAYREGDAAEVVALWARLFPDPRPWNQPAAYIQRKLAVQRELFLVAVQGSRVIGTVLAGYDGVRGWIYHLAVAGERRRQGCGRALMAEAEARLRALGCAKINLQIMRANAAVVGFYERIGYGVEDRVSMGKRLG